LTQAAVFFELRTGSMGGENITSVVFVCVDEETYQFGGETVIVVNGFHDPVCYAIVSFCAIVV
jgi:hypothetical protein